jgi:hypothetical protein
MVNLAESSKGRLGLDKGCFVDDDDTASNGWMIVNNELDKMKKKAVGA